MEHLIFIGKTVGVMSVTLIAAWFIFKKLLLAAAESYVKKKGENLATKEDVAQITTLQESAKAEITQKVTALFRDENVRNSIASHTAIESFKTIVRIWKDTYNLFFDVQKAFFAPEPAKIMGELHGKLQLNREDIFLNAYFLGGDLTLKLVQFNSTVLTILRIEYHNTVGMKNYSFVPTENQPNYNKANELVNQIQNWMVKNLKTDRTISHFEFTDDQLKQFDKMRLEEFGKLE